MLLLCADRVTAEAVAQIAARLKYLPLKPFAIVFLCFIFPLRGGDSIHKKISLGRIATQSLTSKNSKVTILNIQDLLYKRYLIIDGATGTEIQKVDIEESLWCGVNGCNEMLNKSAPHILKNIHKSYLEAGADIIKTNTFGSFPWVLEEYGLVELSYELSFLGAKNAKDSIIESGKSEAFVAASLGPGTKLPSLRQIDFDTMKSGYKIALKGLIEGGADLILLETCQDPLQIKAALSACEESFIECGKRLPIMVSVTIELSGTMLIGTDIATLYAILEPYDLLSIGMNCGTGPDEALRHLRELSRISNKPISAHLNAGLPENRGGCTYYPMDDSLFYEANKPLFELPNLCLIGGCCGTGPSHIKAIKELSLKHTPKKNIGEYKPSIASLYQAIDLFQDPRPLLIGERSNATGSKAFRELLLAEDFEGALSVGQEQVGKGAHMLDVSVAFAGRDERGDMDRLIGLYSEKIPLPLMPDSTSSEALEVALKRIGGRAMINSANLEDGEEKFDKVCSLAKRYGAVLVCLSIDEKGMAKDRYRKVEVAKRMYERAINIHGLRPQDLVFDLLVFTIGSGDEEFFTAGVETIEAIRELHKLYPNCGSTLGLSNISFGLGKEARVVLNSIFLHHCVEAGLTSAILNPAHILPYFAIPKEDKDVTEALLFNNTGTKEPLITFINHFESKTPKKEEAINDNLTTTEKINRFLKEGRKDKMLKLLEEAKDEINPEDIINVHLIGGMKEIGELFGRGDMQLPFVLQSAEVMKASVDFLNPYLPKKEKQSSTKLVLGTVKGDVHDVGKNLVDIILSNNGYEVINIGIKAELSQFFDAIKEHNADAVGMSGLLVKSTQVMLENLKEMKKHGISIPVLLGGAALNKAFINDYCLGEYDGEILYCKDAFDGIKAMSCVESGDFSPFKNAKILSEKNEDETEYLPVVPEDIEILNYGTPPKPPFYGRRIFELEDKNLPFLWLNLGLLFKNRWGYQKKNLSKDEYANLMENSVKPEYERLKKRVIEEGIFEPKIVYGYYKCKRFGDELAIYDEKENELERISLPRQNKAPHRSISDYFRDDEFDTIALSCVSAGAKFSEIESALYKEGKYHEYYLMHGLGAELAEALAEVIHKQIRIELGILQDEKDSLYDVKMQKYQGCRYSFGYPACPDLEGNGVLFNLLKPQELGITLSETFQIVPEQSTCALIVHHKDAKYFSI